MEGDRVGLLNREQSMVVHAASQPALQRQDDIFVGKRVVPLLHLQWTTIVNVHLVVLGGIPWHTTIVTPQGDFAEAQIQVLLVGIHRFVMATALLLLQGSRQVPCSFLNPQERECVTR